MRHVQDVIEFYELAKLASGPSADMVRGAIDVRTGNMALDANLHADLLQFLNVLGSYPDDIWGFNLYLSKFGTPGFVEFNAPINVRPQQNNRSQTIEDENLRNKLVVMITQKIRAHAGQQ